MGGLSSFDFICLSMYCFCGESTNLTEEEKETCPRTLSVLCVALNIKTTSLLASVLSSKSGQGSLTGCTRWQRGSNSLLHPI